MGQVKVDLGIKNITILGSGTCVPSLDRSSCSIVLQDQTHTFLVDAGPGTMHRLLMAGVSINDVDAILLSHFHLDHCAEVPPFIFATKYPGFKRQKKLTLIGGTGITQLLDNMNRTFQGSLELPKGYFDIITLDTTNKDTFDLGAIQIDYTKVAHKDESRAFRFTDPNGFSVVYSGDTDYSENLIKIASGADILICESALPDNKKVVGHLTPSLAGRIAAKANVKKLVLTHFYPECDQEDIQKQCEKTFQGPIVLASDMLRLI
ncbi:MAG: MBL fold metallo-hydrolase [Desulfobacteraceae bacterium]|nr:MBL fold metallo-hydrolase [Desulfobacteraceae bacterium]